MITSAKTQISLHTEVLGIRTSIHSFWGHNLTHNMYHSPFSPQPFLSPSVHYPHQKWGEDIHLTHSLVMKKAEIKGLKFCFLKLCTMYPRQMAVICPWYHVLPPDNSWKWKIHRFGDFIMLTLFRYSIWGESLEYCTSSLKTF